MFFVKKCVTHKLQNLLDLFYFSTIRRVFVGISRENSAENSFNQFSLMANEELQSYYMDFDPNYDSNDFEYLSDDYHSFECFNENTVDQPNQTSSLNSGETETATANEDSMVGIKVKIYVQKKLPFISVDGDGQVLEAQPNVTPKSASQRKYYFFSFNCILNTNFQETLNFNE